MCEYPPQQKKIKYVKKRTKNIYGVRQATVVRETLLRSDITIIFYCVAMARNFKPFPLSFYVLFNQLSDRHHPRIFSTILNAIFVPIYRHLVPRTSSKEGNKKKREGVCAH